MKQFTLLLTFILSIAFAFTQDRDPEQFKSEKDTKLLKMADDFRTKQQAEKAEAIRVAQEKGWVIRAELDDGSLMEIVRIDKNGIPEYDITNNLSAARTSETDHLWSGGVAGLNLSGAGMLIGEWDGGGVLTTHQEFDDGSGTRVTQKDSPVSTHYHSTHVAGTIIAEGQVNSAHGMAWEASLDAYDWDDDMAEMATAAAYDDLILSNHSYGRNRGWNSSGGNWYWWGDVTISTTEDYQFGFYGDLAHDWDEIAHNAPHYLICKAAGNDRDDDHSGGHYYLDGEDWTYSTAARDEDGGSDGYDCIGNRGVAKNILTVGAVWDIPGGYSNPIQVVIEDYSGWGPTDDGRIKPDIVANGRELFSTTNTGNSDYITIGGTSMATPTVTGTLALIQEHYENLRGAYMNAAVLKGLALNTAHEAGTADGPDYQFGWGLLNATGMAELVTNDNDEGGLIVEAILEDGETDDYTYYCDGSTDINVTICWNDLPHDALNPSLNPTTKAIINDLNLRILNESSAVSLPWILNPFSPASAATKGHNSRDNVETINIQNPEEGFYTVRIHHSGTLSGEQTYALIINGMSTPPEDNYCETRHTSWETFEYIKNVSFGSIDNNTGRSPGGYADFTGFVSELTAGNSETINVTTQGYTGDQGTAWVDWNQDGDFDDTGEAFDLGTGGGPYSAAITAPVDAANGYTTMRVCLSFNQTPIACGNLSYGETEDYTINVINTVNYWTGAFNSFWHNNSNWSLGHIPTVDEDVIITSAGFHPPKVSIHDEVCNNLTINADAGLNIKENELTVNGSINIFGELGMINNSAILRCYGDVTWESGSTADFSHSGTFWVYGDWNFEEGSNAQLENGGVAFTGTGISWIRCYSSTSKFNNLGFYNADPGWARFSNLSTEPLVIEDLLYIHTNGRFGSSSNENIFCRGSLYNNGEFDFTTNNNTGTFVFDGEDQVILYNSPTGIFNNLTINSSTGTSANGDVVVNGNLSITNGNFDPEGNTVTLGGNWINTVGPDGFIEGTGRVTFNGTNGHQYCSSETFNILEINKTDGAALRLNGTTVTCNSYDWTAGALDVLSGTFTALDLFDNGIHGSFYTNTNGYIHLHQDPGSYIDLNGHLIFSGGGEIHVYGGKETSYWPYNSDASLTMNGGGIFDIHDHGIFVRDDPDDTLIVDIDNGIIRTGGGFISNRADFTPTSGIVELYGANTALIEMTNGSTLHNLVIDKDAKDGGTATKTGLVYDSRSGKLISDGSRANDVLLSYDATITNDLLVVSGTLNLNGFALNVDNDIVVDATLTMSNPTEVLNIGNDIKWNSGSFANITDGTINLNRYFYINDGSTVQIGIGNTLNFVGDFQSSIKNLSATSEIGNLSVSMPSGTSYIHASSTHPVHVVGDMTVLTGNTFNIQSYELMVDGVLDIQAGATMMLGTTYGGGYLENIGNLLLSGNLIVDFEDGADQSKPVDLTEDAVDNGSPSGTGSRAWYPGEVLAHGEFSFNSAATMSILGGGSFIWDSPYISGINSFTGTLNLDDGLFEVTDRNIGMAGTYNVNGGTIRAGRTFIATSAGNFQPLGGVVELVGSSSGSYILINDGNYFNDLLVDRSSSISAHPGSVVDIRNDFTIDGGGLFSNSMPFFVGGDWNNNVGPSAFVEGTGTVTFNGNWEQNCSTEEFYNLVLNKPTGDLQLFEGQTVSCETYQWLGGEIYVESGTFTANDLVDNGIFGKYFLNGSNATINLYQDDLQYVDFNGFIRLDDGEMNIFGGSDDSHWPFADDAEIVMSGGILDFHDKGIVLFGPSAHTLITDITGGTIRTAGNFYGGGDEFTPSGGAVELYGDVSAFVGFDGTSNFHDLVINKTASNNNSSTTFPYIDRTGKKIIQTRGTDVTANNDITVDGDLVVEAGTFSLNGFAMEINDDVTVNDGSVLNVDAGAQLLLSELTTLNVESGGLIELLGVAGDEAIVSHTTGYYDFNVLAGGTISADHAIFEYMGGLFGIRVRQGAFIDPVNRFNNCEFRNGNSSLSNGSLLSINNNQVLTISNASFPTSGTDYNVGKALNQGNVTFTDYTGAFSGEDFDLDPHNKVEWFDPQLSATPTTINVMPPAGSTTFDITSNVDWTITEGFGWLTVDPTEGSNDATITINYNLNPNTYSRTGTITISAPDVPDVIVTITQEGIQLTITPPERIVSAAAGTTTFTINCNTNWTASAGIHWLSVEPPSGFGNGVITVTYDENTSLPSRTAGVNVYANVTYSRTGVVKQWGADPYLSITPPIRDVSSASGSTTFNLESNTSWTVSESTAWFTVAPMSGSGNGIITVNYGENATGLTRGGNIEVMAIGGFPSEIVTVTQPSYPSQIINLSLGWNPLSSYIMPVNNAIEDVLPSPLAGFVIATTMMDIYYPAGPVNTIIDWDSQSAYRVKMSSPATFPIIGIPETNKIFTMASGWNLVPVICNTPVDAASLFAANDFEIVKDVAGTGVLWPDLSINSLGDLDPGKAYYALLNTGGSITFPPNSAKAAVIEPTMVKMPKHPWNKIQVSSSSHLIAIVAEGMEDILPGDVIGVFSPDGTCYGVSEVNNPGQNMAISVYADDATTDKKDGFVAGEAFSLRLYSPESREEYDLEVVYDPNMSQGMFFENEGVSAISQLKLSSSGLNGNMHSSISIYPNPTNDVVWINGLKGFDEFSIIGNTGKVLYVRSTNGQEKVSVDLSAFSNGIYQLKLTGDNSTVIRKIIKN